MYIKNIYHLTDYEDEIKYLNGYVFVSHDNFKFPCHVKVIDEGFNHARIVGTSQMQHKQA